jgi:methionyl-tRNA formyltransferase
MKIIFFGTGKFGLPTFKGLIESDHEVAAVVTQPDPKRGRGWNVQPTPVKALAEQISPGINIFQPEKVSDPVFTASLRKIGADVFVVVDYGQLLSKEILELPRKYCVNLHPSLLPKYRGASPVNRAILNGDAETGNTVMKMAERMDAGSIIMQEKTGIAAHEDAAGLLERLSRTGADLMLRTLEAIETGRESLVEQDENEASYAPKLRKQEGEIDWARPASEIIRKIKGMQPWPGAFTYLGGKMLKILEAVIADAGDKGGIPGTIRDEKELLVNTGEGAIRVNKLQLAGKKAMTQAEFLRGHRLEKGAHLG